MRRRAKTDGNHIEIREGLRKAGRFVVDTSAVGNGFPDLLIYHPCCGLKLLEVKDVIRKNKNGNVIYGILTEEQQELHKYLPIAIVHNIEEAIEATQQ